VTEGGRLKQHLVRYTLGLLILLALLGHLFTGLYQIPFVNTIEQKLYDARIRLTMPRTVDQRVVLLDIDEKSLSEIGRWPWRRDKMAEIMNKLFDRYQIRLVGFDVVMAEPDESSGLKVLETLGQKELKDNPQFQATFKRLKPQLARDTIFANSLKKRATVLGYYMSNEGVNNGVLPQAVLPAGAFEGRPIQIAAFANFGANLRELQQAAMSAGHFNPFIDNDGTVRRVPLVVNHNGSYYESLSLAMVRALVGSPPVVPLFGDAGDYAAIEFLTLPSDNGTLKIPVDENVAALVPYRGPQGSFRYISLADVLADRVPLEQLRDKIAIVGTSAPGLLDHRTTPVGEVYPGMEVHANLISGMLEGRIKYRPQYVNAVELLTVLLIGIAMIFMFPWHSPLRATTATLGLLAVVVGLNLYAWQYVNAVLPLAGSLLLLAALFVLNMSYGYFVESKAKRQFTELFGQYVPPELVEEMSRNPESYSMEGRKAELTVLFSDVRGFTTISEGMEPKKLEQLMNEYLGAMTLVIRKHRGTLDKYIGDAIMAFWGAPVADADHPRNGVITALEMHAALTELNKALVEKGFPALKIGVGVNTGDMTVGDMGSVIRKAYTVMGDAVNLGARLESITKKYGVGIIVGESTRNAVKDVVFKELDLVQVVGKVEPVAMYEPLGVEGTIPADVLQELETWHQALRCYRERDWDRAEQLLKELLQRQPDSKLYALYMERIADWRTTPPDAGWTGVTKLDTK
jgi:adenylate cyclase